MSVPELTIEIVVIVGERADNFMPYLCLYKAMLHVSCRLSLWGSKLSGFD